MELKKITNVVFHEDIHKYFSTTDGHELIGVTTLMKKHGLSPDYTMADRITLHYAAQRGKAMHKLFEDYDNGIKVKITDIVTAEVDEKDTGEGDTKVIVPRFGEDGKPIERILLDKASVKKLFDSYKKLGLSIQASEYLIADPSETVASSIDKVTKENEDGTVDLGDVKFTSSVHHDALEVQLSIYAREFEIQTGIKVRNLFCIWGDRKSMKTQLIPVRRIKSEWVDGLIMYEQSGMIYDIPREYTEESKDIVYNTEMPDDVQSELEAYLEMKARYEEAGKWLDDFKARMIQRMEESKEKSWPGQGWAMTYVAPAPRVGFDLDKFKKEQPELYEKYNTKETISKQSIRITVK